MYFMYMYILSGNVFITLSTELVFLYILDIGHHYMLYYNVVVVVVVVVVVIVVVVLL